MARFAEATCCERVIIRFALVSIASLCDSLGGVKREIPDERIPAAMG
jgi:hypothetical protein